MVKVQDLPYFSFHAVVLPRWSVLHGHRWCVLFIWTPLAPGRATRAESGLQSFHLKY